MLLVSTIGFLDIPDIMGGGGGVRNNLRHCIVGIIQNDRLLSSLYYFRHNRGIHVFGVYRMPDIVVIKQLKVHA